MLKVYIGAAVAVALAAGVAVTYSHYSSLVAANARQSGEITQLKADLRQEQGRVEAYKASLSQWELASQAQVLALDKFSAAQREAGAYQKVLADVLSKHDLGALAKRKPGLVESRVNAGSDRANRLLESATGSAGSRAAQGTSSGSTP